MSLLLPHTISLFVHSIGIDVYRSSHIHVLNCCFLQHCDFPQGGQDIIDGYIGTLLVSNCWEVEIGVCS